MAVKDNGYTGLTRPSDIVEEIRLLTENLDDHERARVLAELRKSVRAMPTSLTSANRPQRESSDNNLQTELARIKSVLSTTQTGRLVSSAMIIYVTVVVLIGAISLHLVSPAITKSLYGALKGALTGSSGILAATIGLLTIAVIWLQAKVQKTSGSIDASLSDTLALLQTLNEMKDDDG